MAVLSMTLYSSALHMDTGVNVFLPENRDGSRQPLEPDRKYQVLYLLHGMSEDQGTWVRKSTVELVARERAVVVVMPTTGTGFYVNQRRGQAWLDWVAYELPDRMCNYFPVSCRREDTFVMGNSMGGYGAVRMALERPDRFAAAVSLSGALQPYEEYATPEELAGKPGSEPYMQDIRANTFGTREEYLEGDDNLVNLAQRIVASDGPRPRLMLCCGQEDPVTYRHLSAFRKKVDPLGLDYTVMEGHGGHNFTYWNTLIEPAFDFMGIQSGTKLAWT